MSCALLQRGSGNALVGAALAMLSGCQAYHAPNGSNPLAGTQWVLIEYKAPQSPAAIEVPLNRYTLTLDKHGTVSAKLDCNNGTASWTAAGRPSEGSISFGPVAATRALCPADSLGEQLAGDLPRLKVWSLYDGRLTLKTDPAGPEYVWDTID